MKSFLLSAEEVRILQSLVSIQVSQIVWDLDAFYFVLTDKIIKVEIEVAVPESEEPYEYDEVFYIEVKEINENTVFCSTGEEGFWYKVIKENETVLKIKLVRTIIKFPEETLINPDLADWNAPSLNFVNCGLLFYVKDGVVPAVVFENSFGFDNCDKIEIYQEEEIIEELGEKYQIIDISVNNAKKL